MDQGKLFGRGMAFPPRVGRDGRIEWSEGEQNIRESIQLILQTEPGERQLLPDFGAGLGRFLHEPNTHATRHAIASRITQALAEWESRITVIGVEVSEATDAGGLLPSLETSSEPASEVPSPFRGARAAVAVVTYRLVATSALERVNLRISVGGS
jgi:phage baseplate assembly protein W